MIQTRGYLQKILFLFLLTFFGFGAKALTALKYGGFLFLSKDLRVFFNSQCPHLSLSFLVSLTSVLPFQCFPLSLLSAST